LVLTPFEKKLEVWKQLWKVVDKSDVLIQILDARDPYFYRTEDLEIYAKSLNKKIYLLLNKADLVP
jgi:large subunit GTPase 1